MDEYPDEGAEHEHGRGAEFAHFGPRPHPGNEHIYERGSDRRRVWQAGHRCRGQDQRDRRDEKDARRRLRKDSRQDRRRVGNPACDAGRKCVADRGNADDDCREIEVMLHRGRVVIFGMQFGCPIHGRQPFGWYPRPAIESVRKVPGHQQ